MLNRNHLGQVENSLSFHCLLDRSKKRSWNFWVLHPDCLLGLKELRWGTPLPKLKIPLVCKENVSLMSLQVCGQMSKLWPHYLALRKRAEVPKAWSLALRSSLSQGKQNPCESGGSSPVAARSSDESACLGSQAQALSSQACWIPSALSGLAIPTCGNCVAFEIISDYF